jgi:photosystem II stability/assembly factor-like uncharacterized protein
MNTLTGKKGTKERIKNREKMEKREINIEDLGSRNERTRTFSLRRTGAQKRNPLVRTCSPCITGYKLQACANWERTKARIVHLFTCQLANSFTNNKGYHPLFSSSLIARSILLMVLLFHWGAISGKSFEYRDERRGSQIVTGEWTLQPNEDPSSNNRQQVHHAFILRVDPSAVSDLQASVTLRINLVKDGMPVTLTPELEVDYTAGAGNKSKDRAIYLLKEEGLLSGVSITSISGTVSGLILEHVALVERLYDFTPSLIPSLHPPVTDAGEYKIRWDALPEAEEYQLEWVHVNNYPGVDNRNTSLEYDFSKNSTRISTTGTEYTISHVFDQGYLLCRVRAIGYADFEKKHIIAGKWSCESSGNVATVPSSGGLCLIEITTPHTGDNLNWQYITNYSEEGKKKEVVTYYDGTMRPHQAVTRLNTDNNILIGETFYDHQGRASVQTLPVPAHQGQALDYYPGFHLNESGHAYSRSDFDKDREDDSTVPGEAAAKCGLTVRPMSTDSGSSRYYSANNPDKHTEFNKFIPDSEQYPFSQTEYEPDNTGRIRSQGGAGKDYQIGSGHETRYFYGKPSQEELNRLFGSEAGHWSHYQKNVVQDANGQLSVTYMDMQGKVVATSLAGNPAEGLSVLDSNRKDAAATTTINVLDNQPAGFGSTRYVSTYHHLVTTSGEHTFRYVMPSIYLDIQGILPSGMCLDSLFELSIDILDECGRRPVLKRITPGITSGDTLPILVQAGAIGQSCPPEKKLELEFETRNLATGKYTISRVLTLNKKRLTDTPVEWFTVSLDSLIRIKISEIDTSNCFLPTTCFEKCLGSANEDSCRMMCSYTDECEILEELLSSDYVPGLEVLQERKSDEPLNGNEEQVMGGQYALYRVRADGTYEAADSYSIFHTVGPEELCRTYPYMFAGKTCEEATIKDFVDNFQPGYAKILSEKYHPERSCLEQCRSFPHTASALFDHRMLHTETYEEAYRQGLLTFPLYKDPFYMKPGMSMIMPDMQSYMSQQSWEDPSGQYEPVEANIWEMAAYMATGNLETARNFQLDLSQQTHACTCIRDRVWEYFRSLYLSRRNLLASGKGYQSCPAGIPPGKTRRFKRDTDFFTPSEYAAITHPMTAEQVMDLGQSAEIEILRACEKQAEIQAEICLNQLKGCIRIHDEEADETLWQAGNQTYDHLHAAFKTILTKSCNSSNMFGSSSLPESVPTAEGEPRSLGEAMAQILGGPDEFTFDCNPYLINFPKESGYEYNSYTSHKKIDTCACDKLLGSEARYNILKANQQLAPDITAKQFFERETGMAVDNYQAKVCLCSEAYGYASWSAENTWPQSGIEKLSLSNEYIPINLTCDICVDCPTIQTELSNFERIHWIFRLYELFNTNPAVANVYETYRKRMLTNYLNNKLNQNKSYRDYEDFLKKCNATQETEYCELSRQASALEDLLNEVVTSGPMTVEQCESSITRAVKQLKKLLGIPLSPDTCCNSYIYKPSVAGSLLKIKADPGTACGNDGISNCEITLKFVDEQSGYEFSRIIPFFENIRIAGIPDEPAQGRYYFYVDANVTHQGRIVTTPMLGSACFPLKTCYNGNIGDITLCDREEMKGEDCGKLLIANAIEAAKVLYNEYRDSVQLSMEDLFVAQCMSNIDSETFHMDYTDNEHHYTLYYYDQAGNLVRTIPPEGVELVDPSLWAQVDRDRARNERTVYTRHRMETRYQYNSLNQLVAQYMPDHEQMETFSTGGTGSGLPAGMKVVSSEFLNGSQGVLFGENPQNPSQSLIYTTRDGGRSWQKATMAGLNRLNSISMVDNRTAYIAGDNGTLLKTGDGGETWTLKGSGTREDLIAVCMTGEDNGHFFSRHGIWKYNGGDPQKYPAVPSAGETFTSAWFKDPQTGYAAGFDGNGGFIYHTTDGGGRWEKIDLELLASGITWVQLFEDGGGYALDSNGLLLRTNNSGRTWLPVHITSDRPLNFSKIQFTDDTQGWAITGDLKLFCTHDSGRSWQLAAHHSTGYKDFWISGSHIYVLSGSGEIYLKVDFGFINFLRVGEINTAPRPGHIYLGPSAVYAWTGNTIYRKEGESWLSSQENVSGGIRKLFALETSSGEAPVSIGLTGLGEVFYPSFSGSLNTVPPGFTPATDLQVKGNHIYLLSPRGKIAVSHDAGESWTLWEADLPSGTSTYAFDISGNDGRALIAGDDGRIYYRTVPGLNLYAGRIGLPGPLRAVHANNNITVAAGDNGTVLWNKAGESVWRLRDLPAGGRLSAVEATGDTGAKVAGQDGKLFDCSDLNGQVFHASELAGDRSVIQTVAVSGSTLLAGTGSGRLEKVQGIIQSTHETGNGINAVRIQGNKAFAVGDGGSIYRLEPVASSTVWTRQEGNDIYSYVIRASARTEGKLFAVTADGKILGSTDRGISWNSVSLSGVSGLNAIHFYDSRYGMAVGTNVVVTTEDGGESWVSRSVSLPSPNGLHMTGPSAAVIVGGGGAIYKYDGVSLHHKNVSHVSSRLNSVSFEAGNHTGFIAGDGGTLLKSEDGGESWRQLLSPAPNPTNWVSYTDPSHRNLTSGLNAVHAYDRTTVYAAGDGGVLLKSTDGGASWTRKASGTTANLQDIVFKDNETAIVGGSGSTAVQLTDRRERFSSYFHYDKLGRLVASQNSRQRSMDPPRYSYTRYDALGRVVESGELSSTFSPDEGLLNHPRYPDNWSMDRYQAVRTQYDVPLCGAVDSLFTTGSQQNLRNRVASVVYQEAYGRDSTKYDHATHYSYDIHGNVKELVQDNPGLADLGQQYKKLVYTYDLISGNVTKVSYQPGHPDQFHHRYEYDADNRITKVYTSLDGLIWDNDASYMYYKHGPLARTEIGDLKVQGIDYAYTLQGWIKAVNGFNDMGGDGAGNNFAEDAFAYSLHYNKDDYSPINSSATFLDKVSNGDFSTAGNDLYNGNISKMATAISGMPLLGKTYQYDELSRLVASNTFEGDNLGSVTNNKYNTSYKYDANGNILNLTRYGHDGKMDELTYHYTKDGNNKALNNRLLHVNDAVSAGDYDVDIDDQGTSYAQNNPATQNYKYDKIGNLISDKQEEIAEIVWNVQGKVQEIKRTPNSDKPDLLFQYDAMGNRISKTVIYPNTIDGVKELTTYYVRDAQGNVMAVYENKRFNNGRGELALQEQHIYGSSRLGMRQTNLLLAKTDEIIDFDLRESERILGEKLFELSNHLGNVLAVVSDKKLQDENGYKADVISVTDYYPFGQIMPSRSFSFESYRYGFQSQERDDEISGAGNSYTAEFWQYDSRLGRRWNTDPKPNPSISNYVCFANNPIFNIDIKGDTTYRFNKADGKYLGMFDTDAAGQIGSYGAMKTIGKDKNKQEVWEGQRFEFADPATDAQQIRDGIINKLVFVSNDEIKGMLTSQGAFNYDDKNSFYSFYQNSTGGQNFDYSYSIIPTKYATQGASSDPLNSPSPMLFLPEGDYTAHNHMNFGNYLWAASGYTLGFNFSTLQMAAHANSLINSKKNGYPAQWDSPDDQNSIKKGAFHALQFKYRTILELRHQADLQKQGDNKR